ncbi:MAG: 4'-phosphopantetheinyl transferase superfamily protein [Woeseiaceae bacterium]
MVIVGYTDLRELTHSETSLLPAKEREREFGSDNRRLQFLCGHALLRLLLQRVNGRPAAEQELTTEEGGKPIGPGGMAVSITHTGQRVACCVSEGGQIGIDLERIEERRETKQIIQRFFSDKEKAWLESGPLARFYMLWVLKEAFVKAHGQSIFGGLEKLRCVVEPPVIEAEATEGGFRDLNLYRRNDMFMGLATTEASLDDVEFHYWLAGTGRLEPASDYELVASTNEEAGRHAA